MQHVKKTKKIVPQHTSHGSVQNRAHEDESDPEYAAELEYAREHGQPMPDIISAPKVAAETAPAKTKEAVVVKANQAKAARKARGRGVSGSKSKKQKEVGYGGHGIVEYEYELELGSSLDEDSDEEDNDGINVETLFVQGGDGFSSAEILQGYSVVQTGIQRAESGLQPFVELNISNAAKDVPQDAGNAREKGDAVQQVE